MPMLKRLAPVGPEFDAFVRESSTGLLRTAVLLVRDRSSAEDLLQTALVRTAGRWSVARDNPTAYARRVLVNLAKDGWRNRARRPHEVTDDQWVEPAHPAADDRLALRDELVRTVAQLPARQRAVLVLRYFDELSIAEVAEIVGCTEGTVKSQTHHALNRMRELLAAAETSTKIEESNPC